MIVKYEDYNNLFGIIFWLHLCLEIVAVFSPFLFSWWIILMFIVILSIQYYIIGGCIMNKWQFKKTEDVTFLYSYLRMAGIDVELKKLKFFMRVILPLIILSVAIVWQIFMAKTPALF